MTLETSDALPRICVMLPSYNNDATIAAVLREIPAYVPDIIVVNDGCTDGTDAILEQFPRIDVVRHPQNRGKGAALASGFARAAERGFTHVITMDSDGQHVPADLPAFLAAIVAHPEALIIGVRDLSGSGPPRKSRILRTNSNFWTWVETGLWLNDTQSGFRVYPLAAIQMLWLKTSRYDFEIEVLVKAMWAGVPVEEVPVQVRYGTGSRSHFQPLPDFTRVTRLNVRLIVQRLLLPPVLLAAMHRREFQDLPALSRIGRLLHGAVFHECRTAARFAAAIGVGVFFSIAPIWGLQSMAALAAAHYLRLSRVLTLAASNLSFPPLIPFILYASVLIGRFALTGHVDYSLHHEQLRLADVQHLTVEYLLGAVLFATVAGLVSSAGAYLLARVWMAGRGSSTG